WEKARHRIALICPVSPGMTSFIASRQYWTRWICADDNERSTFSPRFAHRAERVHLTRRSDSVIAVTHNFCARQQDWMCQSQRVLSIILESPQAHDPRASATINRAVI